MHSYIYSSCTDRHFHFHASGLGNFLAEKHWDVCEYKPSISLQDASGSSLAGSTDYLNYGAARCSSAAPFFIADNVLARRQIQYNPLLVHMLTSLFIPRPWKHTHTHTCTHSGRAQPASKHQLRQKMSPTLRPSIVKEHACIKGQVIDLGWTNWHHAMWEQMPGTVSTDPLEACGFSNVRSITSDGGFKSCSFWQSSLVCEYNI